MTNVAEMQLELDFDHNLELEPEPDPEPASPREDVVEYARIHGITVDYTTEQMRVGDLRPPSDDEYNRDLWDLSDASIAHTVNALTKERLTVNRDAALFLRVAHSLQEAPATDSLAADRRKWMVSLKQELPVLKSDYELDLRNFGNAPLPDFKKLQIPSEIIDEHNDEGFEWPIKYFDYPAQCDAQAKAEKITVSREVLIHLQDAIRDAYISEDSERIKAEGTRYKPNLAIRPITPPLLPETPPPSPYIPSSPTNRLPLVSDSSDSVTAEAEALQYQIMAADSLARENSDSSDSMLLDIIHPPGFSPLFETRKLPTLKRRAEDLKAEGPLTPPMFSTSPMKKLKSVSFAETLHSYIPYKPWGHQKSDDDGVEDEITSVDFEFFGDIGPLADQARRRVENEQLSHADTTARVDIPEVDFTLPVAPWNEYSQRKGGKHRPGDTELQAQMKFLLRIKREDMKTATSWHGISALERELPWGILMTKASSINLEEKLHGESEMNKILAEVATGNIATSSAQVWKRQGLRVVNEEEDEEEIEAEEEEERRDMEALIRKRKLEMEEEAAEKHSRRTISQQTPRTQLDPSRETQESHNRGEGTSSQQPPRRGRTKTYDHNTQRSQTLASQHKPLQVPPKDTGTELMFGGFSASTALHKFMETRGKPPEPLRVGTSKASASSAARPKTHTLTVRSRETSSDQAATDAQHSVAQPQAIKRSQEQMPPTKALPTLPAIPNNLAPCSFIVSSTFLQQRGLMKQIEKLYPNAEVVYRDYTLPHSAAKEADILLSPSTGLLFTTLQQVKQRALPGQPDRSPVKERMSMLQSRYERLVVVISEGLNREMEELGSSRPEDPRDKEALTVFESFASQLEGEVLVQYVRGGEQALACATVVQMAEYGLPHGSDDIGDTKPVVEETTWEVFLRRVGLNPFAAQVIVASLRQPYDVQVQPPSSSPFPSQHPKTISVSGLTSFLALSEEERVRWLQTCMGGSRILRRVSKVLDQEWVSAAHGFRM